MEKKVELKPCPFCGGKAKIVKDRRFPGRSLGLDAWHIECQTFGCPVRFAKFTYFKRQYKAIEAWNRRTNDGD